MLTPASAPAPWPRRAAGGVRLPLLLLALSAAGPASAGEPGKVFRPITGAGNLPGTTARLPAALAPHRATVERLLAPAVRLVPLPSGGGAAVARLGGVARLPEGMPWPSSPRNPMSFVGEFDLDALRAAATGAAPKLTASGRLAFFYDVEEMRWGGEKDDAAYHRVVLLQGGAPREAPKGATVFKERRLGARAARVLPSLEDLPADLTLDRTSGDAYLSLAEALAPSPDHRLGGHPAWIQGDDRPGPDWTLLWQIDSDQAAGFMWGDVGRLYLFVPEADLAAGRFDRVRVILQCY